ncbi:unnamed protein product [Symbiodinium natans]|uniref:Uncharacterized protein n=1 Tax=Symbiodinium natans TaxID=878477 RepID=A0A812P2H5_9DINO|nr:unnamed protein product [Symbiodinium natans]
MQAPAPAPEPPFAARSAAALSATTRVSQLGACVAPTILSPRSQFQQTLRLTPRQSVVPVVGGDFPAVCTAAPGPSLLASSRASSVPSLRGRGAGATGPKPTLSPFQDGPVLHVPTLPPPTVPTFVQPVPVSLTPRVLQPSRCPSRERIGSQPAPLINNASAQTLAAAPPMMTPQVSRTSEGIPLEPLATDALPKDGRVLSAVRLRPAAHAAHAPALRSNSRSSTLRSFVCGLPG